MEKSFKKGREEVFCSGRKKPAHPWRAELWGQELSQCHRRWGGQSSAEGRAATSHGWGATTPAGPWDMGRNVTCNLQEHQGALWEWGVLEIFFSWSPQGSLELSVLYPQENTNFDLEKASKIE